MAILVVMALSWHFMSLFAQPVAPSAVYKVATDSISNEEPEDVTISLITCFPGKEIYELCGHSAIRVRTNDTDSVWNYGIFDFSQPNFVYRFVKGETDYKGASYPFRWFMPQYIQDGRTVVEQELNFTPEESRQMLRLLRESVLPDRATYRYNYIKDNCSTRILNQIDSASSVEIIYPDSASFGTFRNAMRAYHQGYPWYQFGIDLALGSGLDEKIGVKEEMFVPIEMMKNVDKAHFSDGRPLVKSKRVLYQGQPSAVLPPTPWGLSPIFWAWLLALCIACVVAINIVKGKLFLPVYAAWFLMLGIGGCLIAFLVFISVHESTNPNVLIWWLNPLQFLFVISMGVKTLRKLALIMAYYNIGVTGLILICSPFIAQSFNPAFFPLLLSTFALASAYAILRTKSSYRIR